MHHYTSGCFSSLFSITVWSAATANPEQRERNIDYLCVAHVGAAASADWGQGKSNWFFFFFTRGLILPPSQLLEMSTQFEERRPLRSRRQTQMFTDGGPRGRTWGFICPSQRLIITQSRVTCWVAGRKIKKWGSCAFCSVIIPANTSKGLVFIQKTASFTYSIWICFMHLIMT